MKVMFMGTPDFAVPCLEMLIKDGCDVVCVVTRADKPKGRGHELAPSPVKACALKYGLRVETPETLKDGSFENILKETDPELIAVTAYGKILPEYIINFPKYGCINIHASLLPALRGAAPIQWSIINGFSKTGVTSMYMDVGLDTGDIILKSEIEITDDMNGEMLHDKLSLMGAETLSKTLKLIESGKAERIKQDDEKSSYAPMLNKENTAIPSEISVRRCYDFIRALSPFPAAHTEISGIPAKIYSSRMVFEKTNEKPGTFFEINGEIAMACTDGYIIIGDMIVPNHKRMSSAQYLLGHKL